MKKEWIELCKNTLMEKPDHYFDFRKVFRNKLVVFPRKMLDDLSLDDLGHAKAKLSYLSRNYINSEAFEAAQEQWHRIVERQAYGSAGFHTYNHLRKASMNTHRRGIVVQGPCIQSVVLTKLGDDTIIDVFFRSTDPFRRLPADMIFIRDVLLPPFKVKPIDIRAHIVNLATNPWHIPVVLNNIPEPVKFMREVKKADPVAWKQIAFCMSRVLDPKYKSKLSMVIRMRKFTQERLSKTTISQLRSIM